MVGFQFQHTALQARFQNITSSCEGIGNNCHKHCGDDSWACYLIDNNGYIIATEDETNAGRFFGEVRGPIMSSLVKEGIFERVRIFDYQAVCFKHTQTNNAGNILLTVRTTLALAYYDNQHLYASRIVLKLENEDTTTEKAYKKIFLFT